MKKQIYNFLTIIVFVVALLLSGRPVSAATNELALVRFDIDSGTMRVNTINSDGSEETQKSNGAAAVEGLFALEWSPDGSKIAYTVSDAGGTVVNVYAMNADGSGHTALTTNGFDGVYNIHWSPDSSKIVYVSSPDNGTSFHIYTVNADGSNRTQLTNSAVDACPLWTSTNKIVFVSLRDGNAEIYTMNADGSNQSNITNDANTDGLTGESCGFDVSSDGNTIVFGSDRTNPSSEFQLHSMNFDGSNVVQLTNSPAGNIFPQWSHDNSKILFGSDRLNPGGGPLEYEIYTMNADGSNEVQLTSGGGNVFVTGGGLVGGMGWSPDDTQIAFSSYRNGGGGNSQVFVMNADGSNQTAISTTFTFRPRWKPAATDTTPGGGSQSTGGPSGTLASTGDSQQRMLWAATGFIAVGVASLIFVKRKSFTALGKLR